VNWSHIIFGVAIGLMVVLALDFARTR